MNNFMQDMFTFQALLESQEMPKMVKDQIIVAREDYAKFQVRKKAREATKKHLEKFLSECEEE